MVASPLARWGSGRATLASYDPVSKRTAVVTTVEVALHGDDGVVTQVVGDLAERAGYMELTADGRLLAIAGESSGAVTVWDLTTGQAVGVPFVADGPISGLDFMPDGSALVVSTAAATTRVPLDGSAPVVLVDATQGSLGQAAIAPDGSWIVVPVASPDVVRIALWRAGGSVVHRPPNRRRHEHTRRVRVAERDLCRCGLSRPRRPVPGPPRDRGRRQRHRHRHHPARRRGPGITVGVRGRRSCARRRRSDDDPVGRDRGAGRVARSGG